MSCPASTRSVLSLGEYALEGSVVGGVVGGVVLPAAPDDVCPGAAKDADGVGVVVAAGDRFVVEVGGPGVVASGVAGEVAEGVADLGVGAPAEGDGFDLARLSGGRGDVGQAGQGVLGGESSSGVADLGEQSSGADAAGSGQRGEDRRVAMDVGWSAILPARWAICALRVRRTAT